MLLQPPVREAVEVAGLAAVMWAVMAVAFQKELPLPLFPQVPEVRETFSFHRSIRLGYFDDTADLRSNPTWNFALRTHLREERDESLVPLSLLRRDLAEIEDLACVRF